MSNEKVIPIPNEPAKKELSEEDKIIRRQDFALGAATKQLILPNGLPRTDRKAPR